VQDRPKTYDISGRIGPGCLLFAIACLTESMIRLTSWSYRHPGFHPHNKPFPHHTSTGNTLSAFKAKPSRHRLLPWAVLADRCGFSFASLIFLTVTGTLVDKFRQDRFFILKMIINNRRAVFYGLAMRRIDSDCQPSSFTICQAVVRMAPYFFFFPYTAFCIPLRYFCLTLLANGNDVSMIPQISFSKNSV